MIINRSAKLEAGIHFITAAVLLLKGIDKFSKGSFTSGAVLFSFGVIVVLITIFHKSLKMNHIRIKWIVYLVEAIALLIIACLYFLENKVYLPYLYLLPSFVFFVIAGIAIRKEFKTF